MRLRHVAAAAASLVLCVPFATSAGIAQDAAAPRLIFQLNNAQTVESGCQLTFVIKNDTGTEIKKSSYNMAIVNSDGQVATLVTFEFRPLPVGRTKVQQFGLAGQTCESISAISINEFVDCLDTNDQPLTVCEANIVQSSKVNIQFPWEL